MFQLAVKLDFAQNHESGDITTGIGVGLFVAGFGVGLQTKREYNLLD